MRGEDITGIAAALDPLMRAPLTVAVGDGGNEIGMGAIAPYLQAKGLIPGVSVTRADHLLLAEVSNWGAYGLVAMLDVVTGRDTLPDGATEAGLDRSPGGSRCGGRHDPLEHRHGPMGTR